MPDRKQKVKFIYVVIAVGCSAVACVCLHLGMHGIVINYGIRFYRSLRNILFSVSAVISVAVTALYVSDAVKQRKWQSARDEEAAKAEVMRQEALREQEKCFAMLCWIQNLLCSPGWPQTGDPPASDLK